MRFVRIGTDRFKASLARAKAAHLDTLLKNVRLDERREATPAQVEARRLAIQRNVADPLAARVRLVDPLVVTQEDLLAGIARLRPEEAALSALEIRLYQVRIAELEGLTGLDFGPLSQHDAKPGQESLALDGGLPIVDEAQILF